MEEIPCECQQATANGSCAGSAHVENDRSKETKDKKEAPVTFLRIKRRIQDDPTELLVLSYKRMRKDTDLSDTVDFEKDDKNSNKDELKSVLRFAGTFNENKV